MNEIVVTGDNIESFIDAVIEAAQEGYVRVDTMELSMAVTTNYWRCTMRKSVEVIPTEVGEVIPTEVGEVIPTEVEVKKVASKGAVKKDKE